MHLPLYSIYPQLCVLDRPALWHKEILQPDSVTTDRPTSPPFVWSRPFIGLYSSLLARVTTWSNPGSSAEYACHSSSMGLVWKYHSKTNRKRSVCCAARKPSRSICTTWEMGSSPSQSLPTLSPSWIWMDNRRQKVFAALPPIYRPYPRGVHG